MKTAGQMWLHLLEKAAEDEDFRAKLIEDPRATIAEEFDMKIPAGFKIEIHEDSSDTTHLVLPPLARLTLAELQSVSGASWHAADVDDDERATAPQWWDAPPG